MNRLKELRRCKGLTQQQVANDLGLNRALYSRYESGERNPSLENLKLLAKYYGVTVDYLLENDAEQTGAEDLNRGMAEFEALPRDLQDKALEYMRMLKLIDETRSQSEETGEVADLSKFG